MLATQMSWIGKWGWGKEIDPAVPEMGVSLELGATEEVEGYGGHPWDPTRGIGEEVGSCLSGFCLVPSIFPSATGTHPGLQLPVPIPCSAHVGTSLLGTPALVCWSQDLHNSSRRAEIWAQFCAGHGCALHWLGIISTSFCLSGPISHLDRQHPRAQHHQAPSHIFHVSVV